jgi:hypothetical protein
LLIEQAEISPKETIKEYKAYLKSTQQDIKKRNQVNANAAGQMIMVPGMPTQSELQLIANLKWEIDALAKQGKNIEARIKKAKAAIDEQKRKLEVLRTSRDCLEESGEYAIDRILGKYGVDRNVYHGKCLIGPHIRKLLERRVEILQEMETEFIAVRDRTLEAEPGIDCASNVEISDEMKFFSDVLQCYDVSFALLRGTRTIFTEEQIAELQAAIDKLKDLWPTQRKWEPKEASVTPKSHNLWFEIIAQLRYLGRFHQFQEDPIERLHKDDQITDAVFCRVRGYEFREECKRKLEATGRNNAVRQQTEKVNKNRERKFSAATVASREDKTKDSIVAKKMRRSFS